MWTFKQPRQKDEAMYIMASVAFIQEWIHAWSKAVVEALQGCTFVFCFFLLNMFQLSTNTTRQWLKQKKIYSYSLLIRIIFESWTYDALGQLQHGLTFECRTLLWGRILPNKKFQQGHVFLCCCLPSLPFQWDVLFLLAFLCSGVGLTNWMVHLSNRTMK